MASTITVDVAAIDKTVFKGRQITDSLVITNEGEDLLIWGTSFEASWLSVSVASGALPENGTQKVIVTFDADSLIQGLYVDTLDIISNDPSSPKIEIPIRLEVISEADIRVSNSNFEVTLDQNNTTELAVTIFNDGTETLNWGLFTNPANNWLSSGTPTSGDILPDESAGTKVIISTSGLVEGSYSGFAWISSNDPDNPTSLMNINLEVNNTFADISFSLSDSNFCPGESESFIFSVENTSINSGNVYTAELSNEFGDFAEAQVIGTLNSTATNGLMTLTFPQEVKEGSSYRIRLRASEPEVDGQNNGEDLEIGAIIPISWNSLTEVCVNDDPINIAGASPVGGVYSGTGITDSTFNPATAGPGIHTITYTYSGFAGCNSFATQDIQVRDKPDVSMNTFEPLCEDAEAVTLGGLPLGGIYQGTGLSGDQFLPDSAGEGFHIINYTYTDINGCTNRTSTGINVLTVPTANLLNFDPVCVEGDSISLSGGFPEGGEYAGPGINTGSFYPDSVGVGDFSISYIYTNQVGCKDTAYGSISVKGEIAGLTIPDFGGVCEDGAEISMQGATPEGGIYQGPGVFGGSFDPTNVSPGNFNITYVYTDGCTDSVSSVISVYAKPEVPVIQLEADTLSIDSSYSSYQWLRNDTLLQGAINPNLIPDRTGVYKVRVTSEEGCDQISAPFAFVATSIEGSLAENAFTLFPNPVESTLIIQWSAEISSSSAKLSLYNLNGQEVWRDSRKLFSGENSLQLDRSKIPPGYYLLMVMTEKGVGRRKIVFE
ncbi:MAG: T9SS type A sorting domain-containing protein [Bacteroidota bacterium]